MRAEQRSGAGQTLARGLARRAQSRQCGAGHFLRVALKRCLRCDAPAEIEIGSLVSDEVSCNEELGGADDCRPAGRPSGEC